MSSQHNNSIILLQQALFKAAKVGHINLMREFIAAGANPFIRDSNNRNALSYAIASDPIKTSSLLGELALTYDKKRH